jgi:uncharacterized membrane protein
LSITSYYDIFAVSCILVIWAGYGFYSERNGAAGSNLIGGMAAQRRVWMQRMLQRDNRMVDIQIVGALLRSGRFFASTAILVVAGLLAVVGSTERAIALAMDLPFVLEVSRAMWEAKLLFMMFIFIYAFFKFVWSNRQYNYCAILIGAAPPASEATVGGDGAGDDIAALATLAAKHANRGIRAYYFGLAVLGWFVHPLLMVAAAILVLLVLYRREFKSRTMHLTRSRTETP